MKKLFLLAAGTTLLFSSCAPKKSDSQEATSFKDPLIENMDTTVNPATDFFQYACGRWLKNNPIPGNERSWGVWSLVQNETFERMRTLSEDAGKEKATVGSAEQKIGDYYFTGMDSVTIEKQGLDPLKPEFDRITNIKDQKDLQAVIALFQTYSVSPLFGVYIAQDEKRSEIQTLHFYQGGIGLPDRDYYFNTDNRTKNIRTEYVKHITNMFALILCLSHLVSLPVESTIL